MTERLPETPHGYTDEDYRENAHAVLERGEAVDLEVLRFTEDLKRIIDDYAAQAVYYDLDIDSLRASHEKAIANLKEQLKAFLEELNDAVERYGALTVTVGNDDGSSTEVPVDKFIAGERLGEIYPTSNGERIAEYYLTWSPEDGKE